MTFALDTGQELLYFVIKKRRGNGVGQMTMTLNLAAMTKAEKIGAMESLWADLCQAEDGVDSPAWHGEILQDRKQRVKAGTENILDWQDTKAKIRQASQ